MLHCAYAVSSTTEAFNEGVGVLTLKVLSNIACRVWALFIVLPPQASFVKLADWYASESNNVLFQKISIPLPQKVFLI